MRRGYGGRGAKLIWHVGVAADAQVLRAGAALGHRPARLSPGERGSSGRRFQMKAKSATERLAMVWPTR
jgi:hypothetical protein